MKQPKILIAEDDPNSALLLEDFIRIKGFDTVHVKDGLTAVNKIESERFDIIIMDLRLPGQNGFVAIEKIRQTKHGNTIPIIVLSAFADHQNKLRAYESGANHVLAKPVNLKELLYIISNFLKLQAT